jgi:hypothetical protein
MCRYAIGAINVRRAWHAIEAIHGHAAGKVVHWQGSLRGPTQFRQKLVDKGEFVNKSLRPVLLNKQFGMHVQKLRLRTKKLHKRKEKSKPRSGTPTRDRRARSGTHPVTFVRSSEETRMVVPGADYYHYYYYSASLSDVTSTSAEYNYRECELLA